MSRLLKVLTQIEKGDQSALLCELPQSLVEGLKIQADGSVDTETLFKICHRIMRVEKLTQKIVQQEAALEEEFKKNGELMRLIFDSSIAVEPKQVTE